ncbi:hypothetical protein G9C98_006062 [Cotesia typhae]|uniref:MI domain-containing protein n=1 Tax=Cotesia typhae TaxID=2053667 RepID=A0A8J5RA07_9HYME|nr:hypothetical protein G9C98_006062 [Cotesia typhae]
MTISSVNNLKINGESNNNKQYDRDFLMKLRDIPQCKIKPAYLTNRFESIHKSNFREFSSNRNGGGRINGFNSKSHHQLFPSFAKPSGGQLSHHLAKRSISQENVARPRRSGMIHVSLSLNESIKLRESTNAWKPTLLKKKTGAQVEEETQVLYKKVRSVLNKLTPEKFDKLVGQVRALEIDSQDKLQGVINLVFNKAIDEPNFTVAYVLMCKELALMKVNTQNEKNSSQENGNSAAKVNFRKLLITRCQVEFEKNKTNETQRTEKVKEIEGCNDAKKKKDLQSELAEYDRKIRIKSVGNIKFIGELYKQRMLTSNIMNLCINHLLQTPDEENLECLCKLLTTIGKIFEKTNDLSLYFKKLSEFVNQKGEKKINSRIRFMIQDIIDLRLNQWIPRHNDNNPKTISQIQKEVETKQFINSHLNSSYNPLQDSRIDNRRRSLMGPPSHSSNGWSVATSKSRQSYTIETSKLKINTSVDEVTLGSKNSYTWKPLGPPAPEILSPNKFSILDTKLEEQNSRHSYAGSRSIGFSERSNDRSFQRGTNNSQQRRVPLFEQRLAMLKNTYSGNTLPVAPAEKNSSSVPSQVCVNKSLQSEIIKSLLKTCENFANPEEFIKAAEATVVKNFDNSSYEFFVSETMNYVLEKSKLVRHRYSVLLSYIIEKNIISLCLFQKEFKKLLEIQEDLVIDIPNCQTYLVEILSGLLTSGAHPFIELKQTLAALKNKGCGKFLGELLSTVAENQKHEWVAGEWKKSGLTWSNLIDTQRESVDEIIKNYSLEFLTDSAKTNFGEQPAKLKFSRCLIEAILTVSVDPAEMEGHAIVIKSLTSFFVNLSEGSEEDDSEE